MLFRCSPYSVFHYSDFHCTCEELFKVKQKTAFLHVLMYIKCKILLVGTTRLYIEGWVYKLISVACWSKNIISLPVVKRTIFYRQVGQLLVTNLLQWNENLFDVCLASTSSKLRSDPNELNNWIIFCRQMPQWVGNGEFAQYRQNKLSKNLLEFVDHLKRIRTQLPSPSSQENW